MIQSDPMFTRTKPAKQHVVNVETSVQSRDSQEAGGVLERRQQGILGLLREAGPMGRTALEIEQATGEGHGKVSGALSAMHREGMIAALKLDRRNNHGVYVLPGQVNNRLVREYRPNGGDQTQAPPIPAARPRLRPNEIELMAKARQVLRGQDDKPFVKVSPSTMKTLLAALDRLNG
jgi:hypothetical protein